MSDMPEEMNDWLEQMTAYVKKEFEGDGTPPPPPKKETPEPPKDAPDPAAPAPTPAPKKDKTWWFGDRS